MTQHTERRHADIADKLQDTAGVTAALKKAAREAVLDHARADLPIVVWRDQQVVREDALVKR